MEKFKINHIKWKEVDGFTELICKGSKKKAKEILEKTRQLNDKDLAKVIESFDHCCDCWMRKKRTETCGLRKIRKKIGLDECEVFKIRHDITIL